MKRSKIRPGTWVFGFILLAAVGFIVNLLFFRIGNYLDSPWGGGKLPFGGMLAILITIAVIGALGLISDIRTMRRQSGSTPQPPAGTA